MLLKNTITQTGDTILDRTGE